MNRINELFSSNKQNILSVYFCAGAPTLDATQQVIADLQNAGVDMIEIGIPFSDPMADGVVIQNAAGKALENGMSLKLLFEQLSHIRPHIHIPLLLMGYLNPVLQYGFENFCQTCKACGIDGAIIPDLPFNDYQQKYKAIAQAYDFKIIMLITPETSQERIHEIDNNTDGFIYMVSSASTTGSQQAFDAQKMEYFERIDKMKLKNPRMIGFGISNKATFEAACQNARGAIIGSSFVKLLDETKNSQTAIQQLLSRIK